MKSEYYAIPHYAVFRLYLPLACALESGNEEPVAIETLKSPFFQNRLHLLVW
jgi:hypothetical protein